MLRITTGILFSALTLLGTFGLCVSFAKEFDGVLPVWLGVVPAALVFVMGCVGLFVLITTKTNITISKQFIAGKQPETTKEVKKAKRK